MDEKSSTPMKDGFRIPAEWEKHEGTWFQWPTNILYPQHELKLEHTWLKMVNALKDNEKVHLIVKDQKGNQLVLR